MSAIANTAPPRTRCSRRATSRSSRPTRARAERVSPARASTSARTASPSSGSPALSRVAVSASLRAAAVSPSSRRASARRRVLTSPEAHHSEAGKSGSPLWIDRQGLLILADRGGVFAVVSEERSVLVMRLGVPRIERYGSLDCLSCHDGCAGIAVAEQERARHPGVRRGGVLAQRAIGGGQAARQDAVGRYVFGE